MSRRPESTKASQSCFFRPGRTRACATLTAGRAETLREEYATVYRARREHIAEHCRRLGWSFIPHRTDHLASEALVAVHGRLSGAPQAVAPRAAGASA